MERKGAEFGEIYDVYAIRILVDEVRDCYAALGIVHSLWRPIPGQFDDYIAVPKNNLYQSLHTAVIALDGKPLEIQIRTHEMHQVSEVGIAAHWRYKEGTKSDREYDAKLAWLRQLMDWQRDVSDATEFVEGIKLDIFQDQVFVFTPKGDIKDLPAGATPLDFAYRIHTDVGHRTIGAKVNNRLVPLDYRLKNGDIVEIVTTKGEHGPSRDWLNVVRTSHAREKIRQWFKRKDRDENIVHGRESLERELRRLARTSIAAVGPDQIAEVARQYNYETLDDFYAAIGYGAVSAQTVVMRLGVVDDAQSTLPTVAPPQKLARTGGVRVKGVGDLLVRFAKCCHPIPGDPIVGFITRGKGVTVHLQTCPTVVNEREVSRLIDVEWEAAPTETYPIAIRVEAYDRTGLLSDITQVVAENKVNIVAAHVGVTPDHTAVVTATLQVHSVSQLARVMSRIETLKDVITVQRDLGWSGCRPSRRPAAPATCCRPRPRPGRGSSGSPPTSPRATATGGSRRRCSSRPRSSSAASARSPTSSRRSSSGSRRGPRKPRPGRSGRSRPPGIVRAYVQHGMQTWPQPVKLTETGPMFRYDRPQAGRYRQFWQFDIEAIGDAGSGHRRRDHRARRALLPRRRARRRRGPPQLDRRRGLPAGLRRRADGVLRGPPRRRCRALERDRLERNVLRLLDSKDPAMAALNAAAPRITDRLCDAVRRALRGRPRASRRARRAVPARAGARPRPRLLHADGVRVLRHRPRGPAAGDRWRRPLRRTGRAARRPADARHRLRHRARPARPRAGRDRRGASAPEAAPVAVVVGADPDDTVGAAAGRHGSARGRDRGSGRARPAQARQAARGGGTRPGPLRGDRRRRAGGRRGRPARPAGRHPEGRPARPTSPARSSARTARIATGRRRLTRLSPMHASRAADRCGAGHDDGQRRGPRSRRGRRSRS